MSPVDLVNHRLRHPDIDYKFWPSSYWKSAEGVLPYRPNEVAIVTIEFKSTFGDVINVWARLVGSVPYRNFTHVSSEFYADLARHYRRLIDRWVDAYALSEIDDEEVEE